MAAISLPAWKQEKTGRSFHAHGLHAGFDRCVVHDVDLTLVVGIALLIASEVSEIAAHREDRVDARHLDDLVGVLESFQRLNNRCWIGTIA